MTNEQIQQEHHPAPATGDQRKSRTFFVWINFLLIIILFALMGLFIFLGWQQLQSSHSQLAVLNDRLTQAADRTRALGQQEQHTLQRIQNLTDASKNLQEQLEHNTKRLSKLPGAERLDWLLAEAEYLLRLANQRLQLERDWSGAISMLKAADNVLSETRNPRMNPVRALIAKEVLALRAVPEVDNAGAIHRLQSLQSQLASLPWVPEKIKEDDTPSTPKATRPPDEQAWYWNIWFSIKNSAASMVRIRQRDMPVEAPVTPDQQYYLQQNMHLMLEQAQVALLRQQSDLYTHSLQRVTKWLDEYLMVEDKQTRATRAALAELLHWDVDPEVPDISSSLLKLQNLVEQQRRGTVTPEQQQDKGGA